MPAIPHHIILQIQRFVHEDGVEEWLDTPNIMFGWQRPRNSIGDGQWRKITILADILS